MFLTMSMYAVLTVISLFCSHSNALSKKISLSWENITVSHSTNNKTFLELGAGALYSGRLLGLLGPSGSGKTTFLSAISKRIESGGSLLVKVDNLQVEREDKPADNFAFVYQDDHFFAMLTVNETISLAASLKAIKSKDVNHSIVDDILLSLALTPVLQSMVGDSTKRGISGGERKRLSVACELLGDPLLLLADEPTSGLDSFQAQKVVQLLHQLTRAKGISTVCSIHQPRSTIWALFDDILLLSPGGKCAYHGSREDILAYFSDLGFNVPPETNPAEFVIDLVSVDTNSAESMAASKRRIEFLVKNFAERKSRRSRKGSNQFTGPLQDDALDRSVQNVHASGIVRSFIARLRHLPQSVFTAAKRSSHRFWLLLTRALKQTARDGTTNLTRFLISGLLAMIVGSVYGPKTDDLNTDNVASRINIIAQASVNVGMMTVIKTLQVFKKERIVVDRERAQGLYTAVEYLLAKVVGELPLDAAIAAFFGAVLHRSTHLKTGLGDVMGVMAALGVACSSFGLAVGSLCPAGDVALAVGPAVMVVYVMMGAIGPAGKGESLPLILRPLRMASPFRWACEALCATEFGGRSFQRKSTASASGRAGRALAKLKMPSLPSTLGAVVKALTGVVGLVGGALSAVLRYHHPGTRHDIGRTGSADGDRVLTKLDIPRTSNTRGPRVLLQMFLTHVFVAWLGLLLGKKG